MHDRSHRDDQTEAAIDRQLLLIDDLEAIGRRLATMLDAAPDGQDATAIVGLLEERGPLVEQLLTAANASRAAPTEGRQLADKRDRVRARTRQLLADDARAIERLTNARATLGHRLAGNRVGARAVAAYGHRPPAAPRFQDARG